MWRMFVECVIHSLGFALAEIELIAECNFNLQATRKGSLASPPCHSDIARLSISSTTERVFQLEIQVWLIILVFASSFIFFGFRKQLKWTLIKSVFIVC